MEPARLLEQGLHDYRTGKVRKAVESFEDLVTSPRVTRSQELEGLFWLASSLHGLGEHDRGIRMIEAVCFDDDLVRSDRGILYRLVTRLALLMIDAGTRPYLDMLRAVKRAKSIAAGFDQPQCSRLWLTQGHLFAAMGRHTRALRLYERAFAKKDEESSPFADTRYLRSLVPALVRAGRFEDARGLLEGWKRSSDPFATPHLQVCQAEYHRATGGVDEALRWAQSALSRAAEIEDVPGDIEACCAVVRSAPLAGRPAATRDALRKIAALRRHAGADQRLAIDLATADANLGLACLYGGLPVFDPVFGIHYPAAPTIVHDRSATVHAMRRAKTALQRAERVAAATDAAFDAKSRIQEVRRRKRILADHEQALEAPPLPLVAPEVLPETEFPRASDREELPVALACDADGTYLVAPAKGLRALVGYVSRHHRHLVYYAAERHLPMSLDLWRRHERVASAQVAFDEDALGRRVVVRVDTFTTPKWLERLAAEVAHHVGRECLRRGKAKLERGEVQNAARQFTVASALDPASLTAAERLAHCLLRLGRADDAIMQATRALEIDSTTAATWKTLAEAFEANRCIADARHAYEQAIARLEDKVEVEALRVRVDALSRFVA